MKNKLTAWLCLLSLLCSLLTGCGGSTPAETETPETAPVVTTEPTTEPTTVPTEPKTFFEEQGFEFWEGFTVLNGVDENGNPNGEIFGEASTIEDSAECKVTITSEGREVTTYHLADTGVKVDMKEFTLAEFEEGFQEKTLIGTINIKNASDSLYKAFQEEDSSLTKEAWLEQYQNYKVIRCQVERRIRIAGEVRRDKQNMNIGQSQWQGRWLTNYWFTAIMNCIDGDVYEGAISDHPGIAETFMITTEKGQESMALVADVYKERKRVSNYSDFWVLESFFVMVPEDYDDLAFVLTLVDKGRSLEDFEADYDEYTEVDENAWEEKTFAEYTEGKDYLKYYFLSPYHH